MAGKPGFEPRLPGPEPGVLPLNYFPSTVNYYHKKNVFSILYCNIIVFFNLEDTLELFMKIKGKMSLSSRRWLDRQMNDPYVKLAHKEGYRSRAAYKLIEIDDKFKLIKKSKRIVDIGAAPGGWSQLLSQRSSEDTKIAAIDLLEFDEFPKVKKFIGDFEDKNNQKNITEYLGEKADLIVSDMAPATIGHPQTDHLRIMQLVSSAYDFTLNVLKPNGSFIAKIFMGGKEKQFFEKVKNDFKEAYFYKPKASRSLSVEIYVIGISLKCN